MLTTCIADKEAQAQIARCEQEIAEDRRKRDEEIRRNFARAQAREHARLLQQQNAVRLFICYTIICVYNAWL